jgi:hypothetical protein
MRGVNNCLEFVIWISRRELFHADARILLDPPMKNSFSSGNTNVSKVTLSIRIAFPGKGIAVMQNSAGLSPVTRKWRERCGELLSVCE